MCDKRRELSKTTTKSELQQTVLFTRVASHTDEHLCERLTFQQQNKNLVSLVQLIVVGYQQCRSNLHYLGL